MKKRTYADMKAELQEILDWFESDSVEVDTAIEKHAAAEELIKEMEAYLKSAEKSLKKKS